MEQWFGEPWPTPDRRAVVCSDDSLRIDTPVGEECVDCHEPVAAGDRGYRMTAVALKVDASTHTPVEAHTEQVVIHAECRLRDTLGGPAHLQGKCACFNGGDEDVDPDLGMSRREAARVVWDQIMAQEAEQWASGAYRQESALARATMALGDEREGLREASQWN